MATAVGAITSNSSKSAPTLHPDAAPKVFGFELTVAPVTK